MFPTEVVQRQLDAYNAHDLSAFLKTYSENAKIFRIPATNPMASDKSEISQFYGTKYSTCQTTGLSFLVACPPETKLSIASVSLA